MGGGVAAKQEALSLQEALAGETKSAEKPSPGQRLETGAWKQERGSLGDIKELTTPVISHILTRSLTARTCL